MQTEKERILTLCREKQSMSTQDVADVFEISRQAAHRKLEQLVRAGEIVRQGKTRGTRYFLAGFVSEAEGDVVLRLTNKAVKEHEVLEDVFARLPALKKSEENIQSIFRYAFSEMLNNAIEHSLSKRIEVRASLRDARLSFEVRDYGIGVFRNVKNKFQLVSETEAMEELLKGKTTTAPKAHSGEGIFFTSKIADSFVLDSFGWQLIVNNEVSDVFIKKSRSRKGTSVHFTISTRSQKHLMDLFREYESSDGEHNFEKTKIHVKLYAYGTVHISRSQARRILTYLPEKFTHVVLDFDQVPTVGQAFADEIFRVFKQAHPDIFVEDVNANEAVRFMIDRAKSARV